MFSSLALHLCIDNAVPASPLATIQADMTRHRSNVSARMVNKVRKKVQKGLAALLLLLDEWDGADDGLLECLLRKQLSTRQAKQHAAENRQCRQRTSWSSFQSRLTDKQFRRYFRMERECFQFLCERIIANVGEDAFKSEEYLYDLKHGHIAVEDKHINILHAHEQSTGGFVSGEVKLALTLRLLAGGSYMDLALLFDVGFSTAYEILHKVIKEWILDDRLVKINGIDYCEDDLRIAKVAREFAKKSNNAINGCIGAIDGWIVKIRKPSISKDLYNSSDPKSFFSRKGFFGINVQAIVDSKKRILYRNINSRGAEHDSTAFKNSAFYKWLEKNWQKLVDGQFYFVGDSAYAIKSFLLTPFDNAIHGTPEDNFNFFHSSTRIVVECAFGEIDLRWGILWRPLQFTLKHNINIIDACMRLHNFIVDWREEHRANFEVDSVEREIFEEDHRRYMAAYPTFDATGVHGGEEEERVDGRGRPSNFTKEITEFGRKVRQTISDDIKDKRLVRPKCNWFRAHNRVLEM